MLLLAAAAEETGRRRSLPLAFAFAVVEVSPQGKPVLGEIVVTEVWRIVVEGSIELLDI